MTASTSRPLRFTAQFPCPICGGYEAMPRGKGERCAGYLASDGSYAHCSREELAGGLPLEGGNTYAHRMSGPCKCGTTHTEAPVPLPARTNGKHDTAGRTLEAVYDYRDASGALAFQVLRWRLADGGKTFNQRRPVGDGKWEYTAPESVRVLYRLPELLAANPEKPVFIVEGEKDADAIAALALTATTSPLGAGKWLDRYGEALRDRWCVLIPDNDATGRQHMADVAASLDGVARLVTMLPLPGLPERGDVSDWLLLDPKLDRLAELLQATLAQGETDAAPLDQPLTAAQILGPTASAARWPEQPEPLVYHGLAGEFVRLIEHHTEADPMALLAQFLVAYGNVIGRSAYFIAEADRHFTNLYTCLVGETAKGRKGSSLGQVKRVMGAAAPQWVSERVQEGQSSGEGLIWAVRDPITKRVPVVQNKRPTGEYRDEIVDAGVTDKRLLAAESEFASLLRVLERDGNTLSAVLRQAWDSGSLRALTKNSQAKATGAHISEIGHITADELHRYLMRTEVANGLGNRFLWVCVRRARILPDGGNVASVDFGGFCRDLERAIDFGAHMTEMARDGPARSLWHVIYADLSEGRPGMAGALLARAEAQVMRLAMVYALLDMRAQIELPHLEAALALWRYCEDSVRAVFGDAVGDPTADAILDALRDAPEGLARTQISKLFFGHQNAEQLNRALASLQGKGLVEVERVKTSGRPSETFRLAQA